MKCSFCNRDDSDVPCLVAGPADNNICSECAENIFEGISGNKFKLNEKVVCTFCGVPDANPHGIGVNGNAKICSQCVLIAIKSVNSAKQEITLS